MTSTTRRCLYWGLFTLWCVISIAGIYYGMESRAPGQEPGLGQAIWMFYLPTWILSLGMFGGIHGAPGWSFVPSLVLAVLVHSGLIGALGTWVYRLWQRRIKAPK